MVNIMIKLFTLCLVLVIPIILMVDMMKQAQKLHREYLAMINNHDKTQCVDILSSLAFNCMKTS